MFTLMQTGYVMFLHFVSLRYKGLFLLTIFFGDYFFVYSHNLLLYMYNIQHKKAVHKHFIFWLVKKKFGR